MAENDTKAERDRVRAVADALTKIKALDHGADTKRIYLAAFINGYHFQGVAETMDAHRSVST